MPSARTPSVRMPSVRDGRERRTGRVCQTGRAPSRRRPRAPAGRERTRSSCARRAPSAARRDAGPPRRAPSAAPARHLQQREARGEAAADPATEWDPRVGARRSLQEALGLEAAGLRIELRATVHQIDAGRHRRAGRDGVAAEPHRREQPPHDDRHGRAQAQGLLQDGVHIGPLRARAYLLAQALQLPRVAQQALERPRQRGRGGSVDQQRDQFVAQFPIAERRAVLVVGALEHRDDVVASAGVRLVATAADLLEHGTLDRAHHGPEARVAHHRARADRRQQRQAAGNVHPFGELAQQLAQASEAIGVQLAEHRAHDHPKGDVLHPRPQRERLADRPARDLPPCDRGGRLGVALHQRAVKGREHALAVGHVLGLLQQHHRA